MVACEISSEVHPKAPSKVPPGIPSGVSFGNFLAMLRGIRPLVFPGFFKDSNRSFYSVYYLQEFLLRLMQEFLVGILMELFLGIHPAAIPSRILSGTSSGVPQGIIYFRNSFSNSFQDCFRNSSYSKSYLFFSNSFGILFWNSLRSFYVFFYGITLKVPHGILSNFFVNSSTSFVSNRPRNYFRFLFPVVPVVLSGSSFPELSSASKKNFWGHSKGRNF